MARSEDGQELDKEFLEGGDGAADYGEVYFDGGPDGGAAAVIARVVAVVGEVDEGFEADGADDADAGFVLVIRM